jgi:hypothetical protein
MMTSTHKYKVAGHLFEIVMDASSIIWTRMTEPYGPFETEDKDECAFRLTVCNDVEIGKSELVYSNKDNVEPGFTTISIYKDNTHHYFEFTHPGSKIINGILSISLDFKTARLSLYGSELQQWLTFNSGVNFCFLLATNPHNTVLAHSSCVTYKGKAWLFLGKSGTGKSTHSRMWLNALDGTVLMNDDHPVIRINDNGEAIAYGSPWSGKTRCYKNIHAPVGGIIRIVRAPHNKARRLSIIESYASLMTSFSGITWEKDLADARDRTIQSIIASVPCWNMECLPDEDAARVCSETVTNA